MKLTHDKARFHVTTLEVENGSIVLGGNNYNARLVLSFKENATEISSVCKDFIGHLTQLCELLHHSVIIPADSTELAISKSGSQVNVNLVHGNLHYSFPERAVVLCPIKNTSIEDLCQYLSSGLVQKIKEKTTWEKLVCKAKIKVTQNVGPRTAVSKVRLN